MLGNFKEMDWLYTSFFPITQMSSRERSLRATNDELLVSLEEVTRQLEQSRNAENKAIGSVKVEE